MDKNFVLLENSVTVECVLAGQAIMLTQSTRNWFVQAAHIGRWTRASPPVPMAGAIPAKACCTGIGVWEEKGGLNTARATMRAGHGQIRPKKQTELAVAAHNLSYPISQDWSTSKDQNRLVPVISKLISSVTGASLYPRETSNTWNSSTGCNIVSIDRIDLFLCFYHCYSASR